MRLVYTSLLQNIYFVLPLSIESANKLDTLLRYIVIPSRFGCHFYKGDHF